MWWISLAPSLSLSNHITIPSLCEQRQQATNQKKKEMQGSTEGSASTQVFPLPVRLKVPAVRLQSREERGKLAVEASVKATTGSSFRATPTYPSQCRDVLLRFSPPHKLSLYTRTHTHTHTCLISTDIHKGWHWPELTLSRVTSKKGFSSFALVHMITAGAQCVVHMEHISAGFSVI